MDALTNNTGALTLLHFRETKTFCNALLCPISSFTLLQITANVFWFLLLFIFHFILFIFLFVIYTFPYARSPNVHRSHKNPNLTLLRYFDSNSSNSVCTYLYHDRFSSILRGPLITISNTKLHNQKVYIQLAECMFAMISTQHQRIGFYNRNIMSW